MLKKKTRLEPTLFIFIIPWLIGFLVFTLYPFASSLYYSFTSFRILDTPRFIGLGNYVEMFTDDPVFFKSVSVTLIYVLISVPLKLVFALAVALLLSSKIKFVSFFRTIYYIPSLLGASVGIAVVWRGMFRKTGILNYILDTFFGIEGPEWLGNPDTALAMLILLSVWQFGSSMIIFLAGLKQVPSSLKEAAAIDGANSVQSFFRISLPLITPVIFFNLIMQCINAFQTFTSAFIITGGGPAHATYLYVMYIYNSAFVKYRLGYASSLSWILLVVILIFTLIVFKTQKAWVHYESGDKGR